MRTQTERYLDKIQKQVEYGQSLAAQLRKECYPEDYGKKLTYKDRLTRTEGTCAYRYREARLKVLKKAERMNNNLVKRYYQLLLKYPKVMEEQQMVTS